LKHFKKKIARSGERTRDLFYFVYFLITLPLIDSGPPPQKKTETLLWMTPVGVSDLLLQTEFRDFTYNFLVLSGRISLKKCAPAASLAALSESFSPPLSLGLLNHPSSRQQGVKFPVSVSTLKIYCMRYFGHAFHRERGNLGRKRYSQRGNLGTKSFPNREEKMEEFFFCQGCCWKV
jgi:hypothetical protein